MSLYPIKHRKRMEGREDYAAIIGRTAYDSILGNANLDFRASENTGVILFIKDRFHDTPSSDHAKMRGCKILRYRNRGRCQTYSQLVR